MYKRTIKIRYLKAHDFKSVLATGVYGGLGSNGLINANFFLDRVIIPNHQIIEIDEEANRADRIVEEQKDGEIAREVHCGIIMDVNTAKIIAGWLTTKINEYEELIKNSKL